MSETQPDLREALARAIHREADDGSNWALMPEEHRDCWRQSADRIRAEYLAPILAQVSALQAEVERLQKVEGERGRLERDPSGPGSHASHEAPSDLRPEGFDPSREIHALSDKASPGPWHYRPERHDDWGFIRAPRDTPNMPGDVVAVSRGEWCDTHDAHRAAGTDPYEANGRFIVALANAFRSGRLVIAPCDRSGEAGETSGLDPQGESTVTGAARQAHIPQSHHTHPNPKREDR